MRGVKGSVVFSLMAVCLFLVTSACNSSSSPGDQSPPETIEEPGDGSYLAEIGDGKLLLHVEGSPYDMGYQHGSLLGEEIVWTTSKEFYMRMLMSLLPFHVEGLEEALEGPLGDLILAWIVNLCRNNEQYIPEEYREEMQGIADGASDAGYPEVTYERVLIDNLAYDVLLSIGYPPVTFLQEFTGWAPHSCDGFVVHDRATTDGRTLMGRSWMISSEIGKAALLIERVPDEGNRIVDTSIPGFVGLAAGMSSAGIGIGMNMVPAFDCHPVNVGMGCLLTARQVLQYAEELSDAVRIIQESKRGVSWIYEIGDGLGAEVGGAVVESSAHLFRVRYDWDEYPTWVLPRSWPQQIEDKEDVIISANHYLDPLMLLSFTFAIDDSLRRYERLSGYVLDAYGAIDVEMGRAIVNYLHTPPWASPRGEYVGGVRALFDLENLKMWALYGRWTDPWVEWGL